MSIYQPALECLHDIYYEACFRQQEAWNKYNRIARSLSELYITEKEPCKLMQLYELLIKAFCCHYDRTTYSIHIDRAYVCSVIDSFISCITSSENIPKLLREDMDHLFFSLDRRAEEDFVEYLSGRMLFEKCWQLLDKVFAPHVDINAPVLYRRGHYHTIAELYCRRVVNPCEDNAFIIAYSLYIAGHIDEALAMYRHIIRTGKATAAVFNNIGVIHAERNFAFSMAKRYFTRALSLDPGNRIAAENRSRVCGSGLERICNLKLIDDHWFNCHYFKYEGGSVMKDVFKGMPVVINNPLFYISEAGLLVKAKEGCWIFNTDTGEYRKWKGVRPLKADFSVDGTAAIFYASAGSTLEIGFRYFLPWRNIGKLVILLEKHDISASVNEILDEAQDLEASDSFAWMDSHATFRGAAGIDAVKLLSEALGSADMYIRRNSAIALDYLFEHRSHGCFSREMVKALEEAGRRLRLYKAAEQDDMTARSIERALDSFESKGRKES